MNEEIIKEKPMEIFGELIKYEPGLLEKPLKELVPISFVGAAAVTAYRSIVSKLSNLPMTQQQKEKTLRDGQDAGKMLLAIETRIGELIPRGGQGDRLSSDFVKKSGEIKKTGTTGSQRYIAHAIADHPIEVAEVIKEAEEAEDIPTKTAVLNKIVSKRSESRQEAAGKRATEKKDKADVKEVKEHPKCVKEYLEHSKEYKKILRLAINCAKRELFAPEAMQFIVNRHNEIRELMEELEEVR